MASLVPTKTVTAILSLLILWIVALGLRREAPFMDLKDALNDIYTVAGSSIKSNAKADPLSPHASSTSSTAQTQGPQQQQSDHEDLLKFKTEWLETELGGSFDGSRLARFCNGTKWRQDVVLQMLHSRGGIGNVRGTILDFIYFAIRSGSHMVLPGYVKRTDKSLDWMDESNGYHAFDNMFDPEWITSTLKTHCPQMDVYRTIDDAPYNTTVSAEYNMLPARSDKQAAHNEPTLMAHFRHWLGDQPGYAPGELNLVSCTAQIWNFDLYPRPRLRAAFGRLLKISPQIRGLAATAVFNMRPHVRPGVAVDPHDQLHRDAYCGVHLRTEADAARSGWLRSYGGFEVQTDMYVETCRSQGLQVVYVASGNQDDIVRFAQKADKEAGITVLSKHDLLVAPGDREALDGLTWDQQGALDWEILSRSSFFSGPTMSSFSWNIAFRRYFYIEGDDRLRKENPYAIQEEDRQITYDDGLSRVVFRTPPEKMIDFSMDEKAPRGMFP